MVSASNNSATAARSSHRIPIISLPITGYNARLPATRTPTVFTMRILLAPMEGVVDHTLRAMLTGIGGIDRCVTEFVRVTTAVLPQRVFLRYCPELATGGRTIHGTPVFLQLLGGSPELLAMNAAKAAHLGAPGIDLNFGCPAKTVNRNDGGSVLLKEPERVHNIVAAVRAAVPAAIPVTAKIRLGYQDHSLLQDITQGIFSAGADELTIHARTKADGYRPPAYWQHIFAIQAQAPVPVIANGEIWTVADARSCRQQSGCGDIMLGRGLLACPDLARQISACRQGEAYVPLDWLAITGLLLQFCEVTEQAYEARYVGNRVKQWLAYLRHHYPRGNLLFEEVKRLTLPEAIAAQIRRHRLTLAPPQAA